MATAIAVSSDTMYLSSFSPSVVPHTKEFYPTYKTDKKTDKQLRAYYYHATKSNTESRNTKVDQRAFERWINLNGGEEKFRTSINSKPVYRRKRSGLSIVSCASSSSSSEDEEEDDYIHPTTFPISTDCPKRSHPRQQQAEQTPVPHKILPRQRSKPLLTFSENELAKTKIPVRVESKKPSSWLTALFQKQQQQEQQQQQQQQQQKQQQQQQQQQQRLQLQQKQYNMTIKRSSVSNFFSSLKKPTTPQPTKYIPPLPKRYPLPVERVIYQISFMKLAYPRRPLRHEVCISNMIYWYTLQQHGNLMYYASRRT